MKATVMYMLEEGSIIYTNISGDTIGTSIMDGCMIIEVDRKVSMVISQKNFIAIDIDNETDDIEIKL